MNCWCGKKARYKRWVGWTDGKVEYFCSVEHANARCKTYPKHELEAYEPEAVADTKKKKVV